VSGKSPELDKAQIALLREKILELVARNPAKAATILTEWLTHAANKFLKKAG
jgi:flagellar biosynthesis/type III secretory pathway M-ring protein FliF/YscJ